MTAFLHGAARVLPDIKNVKMLSATRFSESTLGFFLRLSHDPVFLP
jgi:hypothetical protein